MNLNLHPFTESKFKKIVDLYADDEHFAQHIIAYQQAELQNTLSNILIELQLFEKKHQMNSAEFYQRFQNGELGDTEDFILWAGSYELMCRDQAILNELNHA